MILFFFHRLFLNDFKCLTLFVFLTLAISLLNLKSNWNSKAGFIMDSLFYILKIISLCFPEFCFKFPSVFLFFFLE